MDHQQSSVSPAVSQSQSPSVAGLLDTLRTGVAPPVWAVAREAVVADHALLADLVAAGGQGYGVTTRVGHRDDEEITRMSSEEFHLAQDGFQRDLLDSHRLPARRWATSQQVRCVSLAKAQLLSRGGTGVDPEIFDLVTRAAVDPGFAPQVPLDASYSCGDVIPGAWWATGLLDHYGDRYLGAKQGLTLISGVFVHAGVCLASVAALRALAETFRRVTTASLVAGGAKLDAIALAEERFPEHAPLLVPGAADDSGARDGRSVQDPVSIRAAGSVLLALQRSISAMEAALERVLTMPSDNPVLHRGELVEQDSYMSLDLALATSTMTDMLLLGATWTERVVAWLCSGRGGLAPDLRDGDGLGLIQVPKLVTAQVERLRVELSGRVFASGSSTSHGVEDLWTHGLHAGAQLDEAIATMHELLSLTAATTARAVALGAPGIDGAWDWDATPGRSFRDDVTTVRDLFDWHPRSPR